MNLERSINSLSKRIERFDSFDSDCNDSNHWRGKEIIPLNDWIQLRGTPYALQYLPDDFDKFQTFLTESELKDGDEQTRKGYSDYTDLMEYKRNPNYGNAKCFHCLLSPSGDDPIFIGINRLVSKGLEEDDTKNNPMPYPCSVVNRFEYPYEAEAGFEYYRAFPQDVIQNMNYSKTKLPVPVLALGGGYIPTFGGNITMPTIIYAMKILAQNVTGIKVPNSGHWIPEEQPQFVIKQLTNFFGGNTAKTK